MMLTVLPALTSVLCWGQGRTLLDLTKDAATFPGVPVCLWSLPHSLLSHPFIRKMFHDLSFWTRLFPITPCSVFIFLLSTCHCLTSVSFILCSLIQMWVAWTWNIALLVLRSIPAPKRRCVLWVARSPCWRFDKCICLTWPSADLIFVAPKIRKILYSNKHD